MIKTFLPSMLRFHLLLMTWNILRCWGVASSCTDGRNSCKAVVWGLLIWERIFDCFKRILLKQSLKYLSLARSTSKAARMTQFQTWLRWSDFLSAQITPKKVFSLPPHRSAKIIIIVRLIKRLVFLFPSLPLDFSSSVIWFGDVQWPFITIKEIRHGIVWLVGTFVFFYCFFFCLDRLIVLELEFFRLLSALCKKF